MARLPITNFSRGEFGPELYGRIDIPQYNAGAKELTNFIIQRYGGVSFRPGFRFVGEVDALEVDDEPIRYRYMPFQYSVDQAYVLALGDSHMRVLAGGGFVIEENLKITDVTVGATTILEAALHDYVVGERVYILGVEGMVELNNRFATVLSVPDADHIEVDIDSTDFSAYTDSDGIVRSAPPTPPPAPEAPPPPPPPPPDPPPTTGGGSGGTGGTGGSSGGAGTYSPPSSGRFPSN